MIPSRQPARGLHLAGLALIFITITVYQKLPTMLANLARRMEHHLFDKD
ncbi:MULTISPECIES: hypothetical protein [unclassified Arthrobacter]|nr:MULTISPECIES: hypothetical protein [unclassified Arthrobacter]